MTSELLVTRQLRELEPQRKFEMKTSRKFTATVADGIQHIATARRGEVTHLTRWSKTYLTPKGAEIVRSISDSADDATVRREITRAVGAGY